VALPLNNVSACGVVNVGGVCYQFDPLLGPIVDNLTGLILGNQVVTVASPRSCCECNPACPKTTLQTRSAWAGGSRTEVGWIPADPFVAGNCCCLPDDRFKVVRGYTRRRDYQDGTEVYWERLDVAALSDGAIDPDTGNPYPNPIQGFRRDFNAARYTQTYTDSTGANIPNFGAYQISGPVDCEWVAFANLGGTAVWNLDKPMDWDGNHVRIWQVPSVAEANANGEWARGRIMVYSITATCSGLTGIGRWELPQGNGLVVVIEAEIVWAKSESNIPGPCSGACQPVQSVPPAGPVRPDLEVGTVLDLRSILGGI
jgi:hypothetical protein